jgi:hypothetical protein
MGHGMPHKGGTKGELFGEKKFKKTFETHISRLSFWSLFQICY